MKKYSLFFCFMALSFIAVHAGNLGISKNYSVGAISATSTDKGGIVGLLASTIVVTDGFYLDTSISSGNTAGTIKTMVALKDAALVTSLNGTPSSTLWRADSNLNNGYPIFEWQSAGISTTVVNNLSDEVGSIYFRQSQNELVVNGAEGSNMKILNMLGCVMLNTKVLDNDQTFTVNNLNAGSYIILVERNGKSLAKKILKF